MSIKKMLKNKNKKKYLNIFKKKFSEFFLNFNRFLYTKIQIYFLFFDRFIILFLLSNVGIKASFPINIFLLYS